MTLTAASAPTNTTSKTRSSRRSKQFIPIAIILLAIAFLVKIPFLSNLTRQLSLARPTPIARNVSPSAMVYSTKPTGNGDPVLSAKEEREWNHMAEGMSYYHNHFIHSFDSIYEVSRRILSLKR